MKLSNEDTKLVIQGLMKNNVFQLCKLYSENKEQVDAYLNNESIEGIDSGSGAIGGMAIGIFVIVFILGMAIFIWAIWSLFKYGATMPKWALFAAILGGFLLTPVFTLIMVYVFKGSRVEGSSFGFKFY